MVERHASEFDILALAAALERHSEHPLAAAVLQLADARKLDVPACEHFSAVSGQGVTGMVSGRQMYLGNEKLMQAFGVTLSDDDRQLVRELALAAKTPMLLADAKALLGILAIADPVKQDSRQAIARMQAMGLRVVMLTGDRRETAEAVAAQVGISEVLSEVMPEDKDQQVARLQASGEVVGMVGDGINDAPALSRADVGFAIGAGTDIAIEAADMTLMRSSLDGVVIAIEISKATLGNIKQNLFGAFVYNSLGIPVAAGVLYPLLGILLNPMIAGAAMAMSSVTVVTNANRLRRFKPGGIK